MDGYPRKDFGGSVECFARSGTEGQVGHRGILYPQGGENIRHAEVKGRYGRPDQAHKVQPAGFFRNGQRFQRTAAVESQTDQLRRIECNPLQILAAIEICTAHFRVFREVGFGHGRIVNGEVGKVGKKLHAYQRSDQISQRNAHLLYRVALFL